MLKRRQSNTKSVEHQAKQKSLESQMEQKSLERQMEPRAPYVFSKFPNRYLEKDRIVEKVIFCTARYLLVQNQHLKQKFKHLKRNVWNLFKVYNKTTSVTSFRCLCCCFFNRFHALLWYFRCWFEQLNTFWNMHLLWCSI